MDHAIRSLDQDRTVCSTLERLAGEFGHNNDLAFANDGDQNNDNMPESPICEKMGIVHINGLGDKIQSSSWLLG